MHREKICHVQGQRRSHNKVAGTVMIKSNPILISGWPTNRRTVIPKKFSHCCEGSRPHIRLPSLGIWPRDWESLGNLTLKATGGEVETLGRHKQNFVCITTQGKGAVTPQETESELPASVGGSPVEVCVGSGLPWGWDTGSSLYWKGPLGIKSFWRLPLTLLWSSVDLRAGSLRPDN